MNVKYYVKALLCLYITILLPIFNVHAQALKVGDTLPEELWNMSLQVVNHPEAKETITLSEYKDKLIILDFWATWCGPCIKNLNKLDSLQKEFGSQLAVISVTYENEGKVMPLITKRNWSLPSVISDTVLKLYFPHKSIPHQVWLRDGMVLSIPAYTNNLSGNLNKLLKNDKVTIIEKSHEQNFDPSLPLLIDGNGGDAGNLLFQSKISRFIDAEIAGERFRPNSLLMYNYSVQYLFLTVNQDSIPWYGRHNRIVSRLDSELANKVFLVTSPQEDDFQALQAFQNWRKDNLYCYQLFLPGRMPKKEMFSIARRDLNNVFGLHLGIHAGIENLSTRCLVIVRSPDQAIQTPKEDTPSLYENDGKNTRFSFINQAFSHFFLVFAEQNRHYPLPLIDQTGYSDMISLTFNGPLTDLELVKTELNKNGFDLIEKQVSIPMLVYSKLPLSPAFPAAK